MSSDVDIIVEKIINNPRLMDALFNRFYERVKEELIVKKIEELEKKMSELITNSNRIWESIQATQNEIKAIQEDNKKIWESIEKQREETKRIWESIQATQNEIKGIREENAKIWKAIERINISFSTFTSRSGHYIERTIMNLYKEALELHGIDSSKVTHGVIEDTEGIVHKGRKYEIDFYETNGVIYLFEIKNHADEGAIEQLEIREKILSSLHKKPIKKFLVANSIEKRIKRRAERRGITVIAGIVIE
ncbi:flagellar protein FlgN [Sulfolobus acidocaldarius]|uniref:Conserved protein n=4 Tax=Sulfolobus acidocaldarius TaxID=2285 RepID=Q4J6Y1_SULAC|nr:flagellar protein FlgN [Sulfolobus acidocaldarius]AAY81450.1 conserved protein [Sulfolobus acidocaldarius DSM 639]AGE72052.1 hypothetical protein SacN8_10510 [Sulfolobus acidocaldarius N8]AGE74369.1 hypothetical protein SacRon12I_10765 [Sulfolobus acidocaldarius Ron12/I]ALU29760.1 hypothetical protein ATY89_07290 [Sulfolobus acidocaldarius]ALU32497.1 hypothetical protein ATZ20_10310 [Sulfolobus acidocaldarius]